MASTTVENYLKAIYLAEQEQSPVTMGQLAKDLKVTPGTATSMAKQLEKMDLIRYEPRIGVSLNNEGYNQAVRIVRKHRLVELFLAETLGMEWGLIHEEADRLEHAISEEVLTHLDRFLGNPKRDPHGDPIPAADGTFAEKRNLVTLSESPVNKPLRIARISDQSCNFLDFLDKNELKPGMKLQSELKNKAADTITVVLDNGHSTTLGINAATKILVEVLP